MTQLEILNLALEAQSAKCRDAHERYLKLPHNSTAKRTYEKAREKYYEILEMIKTEEAR